MLFCSCKKCAERERVTAKYHKRDARKFRQITEEDYAHQRKFDDKMAKALLASYLLIIAAGVVGYALLFGRVP